MLILLTKILIVISCVGLLRCSAGFRRMGRELDEQAFAALKRVIHATEDYGYPPHFIPLLILLTALWFMLSVTMLGVR